MANTFLAAQGYDMAGSLMEADLVDTAKNILKSASEKDALSICQKMGKRQENLKKG